MINNKYPKILLTTPTSKYKDYCIKQWINKIKNLTYPNYDIFIIDNSTDKNYHKKIKKYGIKCIHHRPYKEVNLRKLCAECNEIGRKYAIENNYDYMFILESDVFPPKNIIELLLKPNKKVIGACYCIGWLEKTLLNMEIEQFVCKSHALKSVLSSDDAFWFIDGKIKRAFGFGLGCILIHKEIFRKIPFHIKKGNENFADYNFHEDCFLNNIPTYLHTGVFCEHKQGDWLKIHQYENLDNF